MTDRASLTGAACRGPMAPAVAASLWAATALAVVTMLGGCSTTAPEDDPVQIKLSDLDTRLARIERVVANQSLLDLANQVEALRTDLRGLHNDVDELNHSLELTRKQQHDLYADLDQRLKVIEARGAGAGAAPGAPGSAAGAAAIAPGVAAPAGDVADRVSYQAAFDLLKDGQYDRAIAAFQSFLGAYPNSSLADNGQYWLGEAYYVNKSFADALLAFQRLLDKYPQSRKAPDALLKVGFCDYELKQFSLAREALSAVTTQYPDSSAAPLAQQRLDKMAVEKH